MTDDIAGMEQAFSAAANSRENGAKLLAQARALRTGFVVQRAETAALLARIDSDRDVIMAYYDPGHADRALEAMQQVSENMERVNASLRKIVDQTSVVACMSVAQ